MSDDTREATLEEKRVIIAHDCALEILSVPLEDRRSVVESIAKLVGVPEQAPTNVYDAFLSLANAQAPQGPSLRDALLSQFAESLTNAQKDTLASMLTSEQRVMVSSLLGLELPQAH